MTALKACEYADSEFVYGEPPVKIAEWMPQWDEFMHYLYLPVRLPQSEDPKDIGPVWSIPPRLSFVNRATQACLTDARLVAKHLSDPYIYVTAKRGYASPGSPLNRPGWHCDDFGGDDLNYIWCDTFPTRWLEAGLGMEVSTDDQDSLRDFEAFAAKAEREPDCDLRTYTVEPHGLYRLTPFVVHSTPEVPSPGGMRSFLKISVSTHRYNLVGNSHNYGMDYAWPMVRREDVRNQPGGNSDYFEAKP